MSNLESLQNDFVKQIFSRTFIEYAAYNMLHIIGGTTLDCINWLFVDTH